MANAGRSLDEHRTAFEFAFFAKTDEALRSELRAQGAVDRINQLLPGADDFDPGAILEKLEELGLESDAMVVLTLYPLIAVAWADGRVDNLERKIVLEAADRAGISRNGLNYRLLESWLSETPDPALLELWQNYARAVSDAMGRDWGSRLAEQILSLCERVALASGGFLALDKIASSEYAVLRDLRSAFDQS